MKVVVFGSQRIAAIWALRNQIRESDVVLATHGAEAFQGVLGPLHVVRVSEEVWKPPTFPCEKRVAETEQEINRIRRNGRVITEELLK